MKSLAPWSASLLNCFHREQMLEEMCSIDEISHRGADELGKVASVGLSCNCPGGMSREEDRLFDQQ